MSYKDVDRRWKQASTDTSDEAEARVVMEALKSELELRRESGERRAGHVSSYARQWLERRTTAPLWRHQLANLQRPPHQDRAVEKTSAPSPRLRGLQRRPPSLRG